MQIWQILPDTAANGWRLEVNGGLVPDNIDQHEHSIDVSDALQGRDRVMATVARLAGEEAAALDDLLYGRASSDRYGAPLELDTLLVNVAHFAEQLRRLAVSDRWPDAAEITHIMRGNEPSPAPRAYI
jgi:hypothetical protein